MSEPPAIGSEAKASPLLTFVAGNLASISAIGLVAIVVCSTIFLFGYLTVFDWRLIWIIDYPDIFKIGLVVLAVLYSIIIAGLWGLQAFLGVTRLKEKRRKEQIKFLSILVVIALAVAAFFEWRHPHPYQLFTAWVSSVLLLLVFCIIAGSILTRSVLLTAERILGLSGLLIMVAYGAGSTFGTVTKYSGGLRYDVFLKDREMTDVRLVLFTSHHTVLYSGDLVTVLPTTDITKIVAHPSIQPQPDRWK